MMGTQGLTCPSCADPSPSHGLDYQIYLCNFELQNFEVIWPQILVSDEKMIHR